MYLNAPFYYLTSDSKNSILKITATGITYSPRVDYANTLSRICNQISHCLVLPDVSYKLLWYLFLEHITTFTCKWRKTTSNNAYKFYFAASVLYLNPERSATMFSSVTEVPRGLYIPISHSLIVCWRV